MKIRTQWIFFLGAVMAMSAATGMHDSIFNNFLADTFHLSAGARGFLELPREMPGFMVVFMAGLLASLTMTSVGAVGAFTFACGMAGMAAFGQSYGPMAVMMMVGSAGMHLLQPVTSSITISLSDTHNRGRRLGQTGSIETIGSILGAGVVWFFFDKATPPYRVGFFCAAMLGLVAFTAYMFLKVPRLEKKRTRLVFKPVFRLYYCLELLFGARKQIFITFGPWVLIKVYGTPASSIAGLLMIAALIGIVFKPTVGMLVDHLGERTMMMADGAILIFVCLGYGYAQQITGDAESARLLASACLIADNLLFALGSARTVYVSHLAESPQEIASTLALGVTINHVISMTIPMLAGVVWASLGYERLFLAASVLAASMFLLSMRVPRKGMLRRA